MRLTWKTSLILGILTLWICVSCSRVSVQAQPPSTPVMLKPSADTIKKPDITKDKEGNLIIGPDVNLFCDEDVQGILFEPIPCEPRDCYFLHPENCTNVI
jgi:hypothetical protein